MKTKNEYITVKQLADLLFVKPHTIRRWTREGKLPKPKTAVRHGKWLYVKKEVDKYIKGWSK